MSPRSYLICLAVFSACIAAVTLAGEQATQRSGVIIRNAEADQALRAFAKHFCIELRSHHHWQTPLTGRTADKIRQYIHPDYLEKHNLAEGDLPILIEPFKKLVVIYRISDDHKSIVCITENDDKQRELFLFRLEVEEGERYSRYGIMPASPPDEETGLFKPWVLRMTLPPATPEQDG